MTLQESNNAFMQPNHKELTLTFSDGTVITNSNIVQESLMIDEALCSGENLQFGACESSCFSIRIVNTEQSFEGLDVDLFLYMETEDGVYANEDDDYYITDTNYLFEYTGAISEYIGKYKVLSDTPTSDRVYRDLVCYDYMYFLSDTDVGEWYSNITFPISVKDFRDSLFEYMNFTQEETTLINDNYMIVNKYDTTSIGFREVIESICSLNGVFGHINNRGIFTYISLPSADTLEVPYYINGSSAYEDYETDTITGILACNDTETGNLVGTDDNVFTLTGNICIVGAEYSETTTTALQNLLNVISTVSYRPYKVQMYGNPYLELGTNITFSTKYCTVNSIVATRVLSGIQAMRDEYRALGDRVYPTNVNSLASEVRRIKGSTISLKSDVTETRSEVVLKVTSSGKIVQVALSADASTGSEFKVGADNISFIANNKIELSANSLEINSTNFQVDSDGKITATSAEITGDIITTSLKIDDKANLSVIHEKLYVGITMIWNGTYIQGVSIATVKDVLSIETNTVGFLVKNSIYVNGSARITGGLNIGGDICINNSDLFVTGNIYSSGRLYSNALSTNGIYADDLTIDSDSYTVSNPSLFRNAIGTVAKGNLGWGQTLTISEYFTIMMLLVNTYYVAIQRTGNSTSGYVISARCVQTNTSKTSSSATSGTISVSFSTSETGASWQLTISYNISVGMLTIKTNSNVMMLAIFS